MTYRLSICIPTYNRAVLLQATIENLLAQHQEGVQITVSDNASTDGTEAMMREFTARHPHIVYARAERNQGADRNFLKAVEIASGRHAWLMGDDDLVAPGGVAEVLRTVDEHPDLPGFSVNRQMFDVTMTRPMPDMDLFTDRSERLHLHASAFDAFDDLGIYLSFISGQVFRRDAWLRHATVPGIEKYFNGLVHLYVLGALIKESQAWGAMAQRLVLCRGDNDSFLSAGHFKRFQIDIVGFSDAAGDVFGRSSPLYRMLMKKVLRNLLVNRVIGFKLGGVRGVYFKSFTAALPACWSLPRFWLVFVPALILPAPLLSRALGLRREAGSKMPA